MVEAQVDAFAGAHAQGQFMKQQVAAIGVGLIEAATKFETIERLLVWGTRRTVLVSQ